MLMLLLGAIFLAILGLLVGSYLYFNRRSLSAASAARERIRVAEPLAARPILKDDTVSHLPFLNEVLAGHVFTEYVALQLRRAGSDVKPGAFMLLVAASALAGIALGARLGGMLLVPLALLGLGAPVWWLRRKQRRRLAAFEVQLPDGLDMMTNSMRAGYSFQAAARFVGEEMSAPLGPEFTRFYDEQRLGLDIRTALLSMQERADSMNLKMFVTAVLIQRETGGNLAEVLGNLSSLMRERVTLKGNIDTLTAEPKMSAYFLAVLPVLMFFGLSAMNPVFFAPMTKTLLGQVMLGTTAVMVVIGYTIMMKIADIDV